MHELIKKNILTVNANPLFCRALVGGCGVWIRMCVTVDWFCIGLCVTMLGVGICPTTVNVCWSATIVLCPTGAVARRGGTGRKVEVVVNCVVAGRVDVL